MRKTRKQINKQINRHGIQSEAETKRRTTKSCLLCLVVAECSKQAHSKVLFWKQGPSLISVASKVKVKPKAGSDPPGTAQKKKNKAILQGHVFKYKCIKQRFFWRTLPKWRFERVVTRLSTPQTESNFSWLLSGRRTRGLGLGGAEGWWWWWWVRVGKYFEKYGWSVSCHAWAPVIQWRVLAFVRILS